MSIIRRADSDGKPFQWISIAKSQLRTAGSWLWRVLRTTPTDRLSTHVQGWLKQWQRTNPAGRPTVDDRYFRFFDWATSHPGQFILCVFGATLVLAALDPIQQSLFPDLGFRLADGDPTSQLGLIETIWTIQTTLTAVVYPIVIGFVSISLQQRAAWQVLIRIYLIETGAFVAAMASIFLVMSIALLYSMIVVGGEDWIRPALIVAVTWFPVNAALTAYFLYHTLLFIRPGRQTDALRRYAVRVGFPRDVHDQLMKHFLESAQASGLVPCCAPYQSFVTGQFADAESGPKIDLLSGGEGEPCILVDIQRRRWIADVRLRPLRWGCRLWLRHVRRVSSQSDADSMREPVLHIVARPGDLLLAPGTLVSVSDGPRPGWAASWLLRRAFVLKIVPETGVAPATKDVIVELIAELKAATQTGSEHLIQQRLDAVLAVHVALLQRGELEEPNGDPFNAALILRPVGWSSRSLNAEWAAEYFPWLDDCARLLGQRDEGFAHACGLTARLIRQAPPEPVKLAIELLDLHRTLFSVLAGWWRKRADEQGLIGDVASNGVKLLPPLAKTYRNAMELTVHGWENIRLGDAQPTARRLASAWKQASGEGRLIRCMLQDTAGLLVQAVLRNDREAADILTDSFVTRPARFRTGGLSRLDMVKRIPPLLTVVIFDQGWDLADQALNGTAPSRDSVLDQPKLLQWRALLHLWRDLRLLLVLLMLHWARSSAENDLALNIAVQLVQGDPDPLQTPFGDKGFGQASALLIHLVRQNAAREEYTERLDRFCEGAMREPTLPTMPGRWSTSVGFDDMRALHRECLLLRHAFAPVRDGFVPPSVRSSLDGRLRGRVAELARGLQAAPVENVSSMQIKRERLVIEEVRNAAGQPATDDLWGPGAQMPWVAGAIEWLDGLAAQDVWEDREAVQDADGLNRSCGWSWHFG